jgi:PleD family two-component response regulator
MERMSERTNINSTILIVEDIEEISAEMRRLLEDSGYLVQEAADDQEAVSVAQSIHPDLILTDLDLPTLEGLKQRVREHAELRNTPIVVIDIESPEISEDNGITILTNVNQLRALIHTN